MRFPTLLLSAAVAAVLLAGAVLVPDALRVPVGVGAQALVVGLFAWAFPRASGLEPSLPSSAVLALTGGAALATAWALPLRDALVWWPSVLAVGVLLGFVLQLLRGHEAKGRVEAMSGLVAGLLLAVSGAGWGAWVREASASGAPSLGAWLCAAGSVVAAVVVGGALLFSLRSGFGAARVAEAAPVPAAAAAAAPSAPGASGGGGLVPDAAPVTSRASAAVTPLTTVLAVGLGAALAAGFPAALLSRLWG